jgi:hypothetical protein
LDNVFSESQTRAAIDAGTAGLTLAIADFACGGPDTFKYRPNLFEPQFPA